MLVKNTIFFGLLFSVMALYQTGNLSLLENLPKISIL
jgi:hypothetical protein